MKNLTPTQVFAGAISVAVAVAVIGGLIVAGSPQAERMRRADQQRLSDLQQISYAVDLYWNRQDKLPATLQDLTTSPDVYIQSIRDPRSAIAYEYVPGANGAYQLCATFETPTGSGPDQPPRAASESFWDHGVGRTCYALTVRQDNNTSPVKPAPVIMP